MGRTKRVSAGVTQDYSNISINIFELLYRFRLNDYRCNLRWSNSTTLFIGWVDTIRICVIRKRNAIEVSTRNLPGFIVDPSRYSHNFKLMIYILLVLCHCSFHIPNGFLYLRCGTVTNQSNGCSRISKGKKF